jgi:hypothetical protein
MNPVLSAFAVVALAGVFLLLWLFVSAAFLLWGARLAGIERRSFGRAIGTLLLGGIASALLASVLRSSPYVGTGLGVLLGFCVSAAVTMAIFDTTFGKALVANILAWLLPFVLAGSIALLGFALFGALVALS